MRGDTVNIFQKLNFHSRMHFRSVKLWTVASLICQVSLVKISKPKNYSTGCIKKNKTLLFSPNFQPKSLGNGWSDLLKNHCAKSPHCGLFAQEISSDSDKWFPSYCGWKLGEKKSVLFFLIHLVAGNQMTHTSQP